MAKNVITLDEHVERPGTNSSQPIWVNKFDESAAQQFCKDLLKASEDPNQPVLIYIDSYGGYVDSLSSMISAMDAIPNKIITVAVGKAMSCGSALFSHGDIRYVAPHARIMIHEVSSGTQGNINDTLNHIKESKRLNDWLMTLIAKNCGKSYQELVSHLPSEQRDYYLDAKEAVKFGIADHIGIPRVKKVVKFEIEAVKQA